MFCITFEWIGTFMIIDPYFPSFFIALLLATASSSISFLGVVVGLGLLCLAVVVNYFRFQNGLLIGIAIHVLSWIVQIGQLLADFMSTHTIIDDCLGVGHFIVEGNLPSFTESSSVYGVLFSLLLAWDRALQ